MIFLPKPGKSPYNHTNYRHISLLEIHGKIYEKIINSRLMHLLEEKSAHNDRQHGFRPQGETHTALAILNEATAAKADKHNNMLCLMSLCDIIRDIISDIIRDIIIL